MRFFLILIFFLFSFNSNAEVLRFSTKNFTEGRVLAELLAQIAEKEGEAEVKRINAMAGTGLVFSALENGEIEAYPEYTGTIAQAILKKPNLKTFDSIQAELKKRGLRMSKPLGFNNTYALSVRKEFAKKKNLKKISDLKKFPGVKTGFTYEYMNREDGYPALVKAYQIKLDAVGMEHSLSYEALSKGKIDLMDAYSTDAKLKKFDLVSLEDDLSFFPVYLAVILVREDFIKRFPKTWEKFQALENQIDEKTMISLNAQVDLDKGSVSEVVSGFLGNENKGEERFYPEFWKLTSEHLFLVFLSLFASILVGVPLGILAWKSSRFGQTILALSGLVQTIPSLALLCFLIPVFGIGKIPALVALFLYGLLPIVRNTHSGMKSLHSRLRETSQVLGLSFFQRLRFIDLPLASIHILSGIKTSAVINVGTATLAAFIGAGGYGAMIVRGLSLNDHPTILMGAIPAALLALLIHGFFEVMDRFFVPRGLRIVA